MFSVFMKIWVKSFGPQREYNDGSTLNGFTIRMFYINAFTLLLDVILLLLCKGEWLESVQSESG